jgi:4-aminobutyrate aminotransferase / (S)-3-amino-2-methylpropionate transaminase / 5-aminovalerate transaminase
MAIEHTGEGRSNAFRRVIDEREPVALRTYTPTQLTIAKSAGVFHWTADGRKLYDYTSGVLVANLGHNPVEWQRRFVGYMGWLATPSGDGYFESIPLTAYNAITTIEADAVRRLVAHLQSRPGGQRLEQIMWAASGSEAIQKALWAALAVDPARDRIIATRDGFHGKKGLAEAVTGNERDRNRDPRVRFVSFPKDECCDVTLRDRPFDPSRYRAELEAIKSEHPGIACLITEPYLGGGGSYHPPAAYLQLLQDFCRANGIVFILDEIQSNFGRTGQMFAFETYGLEPDIVVLGKGLGNGVPAACAAGRADVFRALAFGEASDTFSANPLCCAAVLATLDIFEGHDVLGSARRSSAIIEEGLLALKELPFVSHVRGEKDGMVWGVEIDAWGGRTASEIARACVLAAYRGDGDGRAIHLMGPLATRVLRIAPPLTITEAEARESIDVLTRCLQDLMSQLAATATATSASTGA